ncbi:hypothetical protein ACF0H5_011364 [Mactra antiquata]
MALIGNFRSQMLWDNIQKGDVSAVVNLLENGTINLEERNENGQTFLMVACKQGEISLVRELMEARIDPNATDNDNWTALLYAAKDGYLEICIELLERGADIEHRDLCNWTALMWAAYNGQEVVVQELLERGADPNVKAEYNMSCLGWASGRGHVSVVKCLLEKGARVNTTDKYGTTPLIWACRKGHLEIVQELLGHGAAVDNTGMDSLTAVLVATKGGFTEVVQALLEHDPNVNAVDKDGFTPLTIAAKEGYEDIVQELLAKDAYVNVADRAGDTILIHAVKGGYTGIVRALLNRYADVDVEGNERKTALYWAVEKGHADIVKLLLDNDADMEISTKDGDTPLMRAVRNRLELIVRMLLDKGAKVSIFDKKGDTALHISLRARSKRITELLLRNPRNSRLLYQPNKAGETPYSIDAYHQKGILTQIHGHRQLNASDGENLLGYEIYSSSLADILSEPTLNTPITLGLYAKWGTGKSFLINKLKSEMKSFTKANDDNQITFTLSLFLVLFIINSLIGSILTLAGKIGFGLWLGLGVGLGLFVWEYGFLLLISICSSRYNVKFALRISQAIGKRLQILSLLLQILFCNPRKRDNNNKSNNNSPDIPLVKFLFSESTKLTSVGGEKALACMIAGLFESVEKEFGFLSTRLFGVFKQVSEKNYIGRFKTLCCIPIFVIVIFVLLCFITGIALTLTYKLENKAVNGVVIAFACVVGLSLLSNIHNFGKAVISLCIPQKSRILKAADNVHRIKIDGFMQILKQEVALMNKLVNTVDKFTKNTTRLVVVVDGLDSCEQEKVLQVLDIIHALFNDDNSSFVVILAVDPQIIIKGIDQNLKSMFHDTTVNGFDYLRNIVHLPFYLQSQGLQAKRQDLTKSVSSYDVSHESPTHHHKSYRHQDSTVSQISGFSVVDPSIKHGRSKRPHLDSLTQITHSNFDISHTLTKNDYFSDINPKSMRRLMNIVAVTGRLLRAYNIDFNWHRLAAWVNLVEQWPYRLSWCIMYFEEHDDLNDDVTLKFIYEKIEVQIPSSSDVEPLLEIDRNVRKLQAFLSSKSSASPMICIADLKKFLPCTINLDPYLRKLIRNAQQSAQQQQQHMIGPELPLGLYSPANHINSSVKSNTKSTDNSRYGSLRKHSPVGKQPMGGYHAGHMMPYGPMIHPHQMMGMTHPYMMGMPGLNHDSTVHSMTSQLSKKSTNPVRYIANYSQEEVLSRMSTMQISQLLTRISGLNHQQLIKYQQAVEDNNITGMVLSNCELDELGKCMDMKFGDWQLFKSAIQALRDAEESRLLESPSAESELTSSFAGNKRIGSDTSTRSIHFSNTDFTSVSQTPEDATDSKQRSAFRRQVSIETQREASDSNSQFDVITEEDDDDEGDDEEIKPLPNIQSSTNMRRNDSVVAEVMYESGLLHEFMQNFTENVSGEEEDDGDFEERQVPNGDVVEWVKSNSTGYDSNLNGVQFGLTVDDQGLERNESLLWKTGGSVENENEPLLSESASFNSSTPSDIRKSLIRQHHTVTETYSEPDLLVAQKDEDQLFHDHQPLLSVSNKSISTSSSGFATMRQQTPSPVSDTNDIIKVVDETKVKTGSAKSLSIQESIKQFTMDHLAGTSSGTSSSKNKDGMSAEDYV